MDGYSNGENNSKQFWDGVYQRSKRPGQERSQEFSKGGARQRENLCRPCGSFFSPVLPSSHFFSKGCARALFAHPLATPLGLDFWRPV
jgi:hypothetical protein